MAVTINGTTGITTPEVALDNSAADGGQVVLKSSGYGTWNLDNYSGRLRGYYNSTEYFTVDASGNMGIGTASPSYRLDVQQNTANIIQRLLNTATSTNSVSTQIISGNNGSTSFQIDVDGLGSVFGTGARLGTTTNHFVSFMTNATERMRIDSSGNVGIGLASTGDTLLEIYGANSATTYKNVNTGTGSSDGFYVGMAKSSGTDGYVYNRESANVIFGTANAERMRIDSSGNLLVNITSATAKIAVLGASTTSANIALYAGNSSGQDLFYARCDGLINTGTRTLSPYNNTTASAANMFVNSSGDLLRGGVSSLKYKTNVQDATHGLADLLKLRSVTYEGKAECDAGKTFGGLIAEEVHEAGLTEFVQYAEDGSPDALDYGNMVSLCIKAIQEQQALIQQLQADVAALKGQP